jgi:hypothetical protein
LTSPNCYKELSRTLIETLVLGWTNFWASLK